MTATPEAQAGAPADVGAEWRKAMEGVTPGPWNPSRFGMQVLTGDSWSTVCTFHNNNGKDGKWNDHRLASWEDGRGATLETSNADWVARCSPAGISGLLDTLQAAEARALAAEAEADRLRSEMKWIARDAEKLERQNRVNDSYAGGLGNSERNARELWLICNGHVNDHTASILRRARTATVSGEGMG